MCRRIRRFHMQCDHWHSLDVEECDTFRGKKEKRQTKRGFWSRLVGMKKISCKVRCTTESVFGWCPFCTRAQNLTYVDGELEMGPNAAESRNSVIEKGKQKREPELRGGPSRQDLRRADIPPDLVSSFLKISSSKTKDHPRQQLPEIRSNIVDPGIDFERWSHARDHIIPPIPGPPPDKPLPQAPIRRQPTNVQRQQATTSQGRDRCKISQGIKRKPVAGELEERYPRCNIGQVDGPAEPVQLLRTTHTRRKAPPPWIHTLDTDRELPEIFPWIPKTSPLAPLTPEFLRNGEATWQKPESPDPTVKHGGSAANRSREKQSKFKSPPTSPLSPTTHRPVARYAKGPVGRVQTVSVRHELTRSVHGDIDYISPMLGKKIDAVEKYWMTGGLEPPEENLHMRTRAETEPAQNKRNEERETGRMVTFDDFVR